MTRQEARALVLEELNRTREEGSDPLVVMDDMTLEKPYGWVFFFNSKSFVETGDPLFALGGNGPVVVERDSGKLTRLGSARSPEHEIEAFEAGM